MTSSFLGSVLFTLLLSAVSLDVIPSSPSAGGISEQGCFKINENDVRALYNQYNQAVMGCNAVRVVALFWDRYLFHV